jgi:hypothetical protein
MFAISFPVMLFWPGSHTKDNRLTVLASHYLFLILNSGVTTAQATLPSFLGVSIYHDSAIFGSFGSIFYMAWLFVLVGFAFFFLELKSHCIHCLHFAVAKN